MRSKRRGEDGYSNQKILRVMGGVFAAGCLLFIFVWWPIQAERAKTSLAEWESQLAKRKAELNFLQAQYDAMTSLPELDAWARQNGPWRHPRADDLIIIEN